MAEVALASDGCIASYCHAIPYIIPSCKSNLRIRSLSNASDGYILSMSIVRVPIHSTEDRFPHV
jgi:hypothetical protein